MEQPGRRIEKFFVLFAVGPSDQFAGRVATDNVEKTRGLLFLGRRKSGDPLVEYILGDVVGIEAALRRFRRHAGNERLVFVQSRPWSDIDLKVVQQVATVRG